ncbi:hypothetical protein K438DRAFT_496949 [Mycena galopus ATCC 62051]|nr:hypothetical protein K438DRAFT_496949 [Mycena galopus ATCC 62051]
MFSACSWSFWRHNLSGIFILGLCFGSCFVSGLRPSGVRRWGSNKSPHLAQAKGLPLANNAAESFSLGSTPGLALSQDSEPPVFITRGSNRSLHLVEAPGRHLNSQDATSIKDREAPGPHLDSQDAQSVKDRESFPWVLLDIGEDKPSQSTFKSEGGPRQFGQLSSEVVPLKPPLDAFKWPLESMSTAPKPALDILQPAPAAAPLPPGEGKYPQAPTYTLNAELDRSYRNGWRYAAPFFLVNKTIECEDMYQVQAPPNVTPNQYDGETESFIANPIPGMVKIPIGISLVHLIDNDPDKAMTVAVRAGTGLFTWSE